MSLKNYFSLILLCFSFQFISAQTSSISGITSNETNLADVPVLEGDNWTFFLDEANHVYYIDFETISVNLSDVKVLDDKGETLLKDDLWDLPVNTIYELNLSDLLPGKYKIELRSYTGLITKEITLGD